MSHHHERKLSTFIIILNTILFILLCIAIGGPWYQIDMDVPNVISNTDYYDLYRVYLSGTYRDVSIESFYVKNLDSDISKLYVAIGVMQWFSFVCFVVAGCSFIHSYRHPTGMTSLSVSRGFTISTFVFQMVATLALLGFNPVFKETVGSCNYSPSPCTSFIGKYTSYGEVKWYPSWGWASAVLCCVVSLVVLICTIQRYKKIKHHVHYHGDYSRIEAAPILGNYHHKEQQPIYYQPQYPHVQK